MNEITRFYSDDQVTISNSHLVVGAETFLIHGIAGFRIVETRETNTGCLAAGIIFSVILGFLIFSSSESNALNSTNTKGGLFAVFLFLSGVISGFRKKLYSVAVIVGGREVNTPKKEERGVAERIVQALNVATHQGEALIWPPQSRPVPPHCDPMKLEPGELLHIANNQRWCSWVTPATAIACGRSFGLSTPISLEPPLFLLFGVAAVNSVLIYKFASTLKINGAWLLGAVCLVLPLPLMGIVLTAVLCRSAKEVFRKNGVRTSWWGAVPAAERARLAAPSAWIANASPLPSEALQAPESALKAPRYGWAEDLRELAKLRDEGIITDQEFDDKKKILMGL